MYRICFGTVKYHPCRRLIFILIFNIRETINLHTISIVQCPFAKGTCMLCGSDASKSKCREYGFIIKRLGHGSKCSNSN